MSAPRNRHRNNGFTLIELVIALAVVAILAAVALPAYREQMRKSVRAEAQAYLTNLASRQQQFLVDRRSYAGALAVLNAPPPSSLDGKFTFTVAAIAGPPPSYTLTANAAGDQAKDKCAAMSIDSAGNRTPASCW